MRFTVSFEVNKDALADPTCGRDEISEVLRRVTAVIERFGAEPGERMPVYSLSGNRIGEWRVTKR